VSRTRNSKDQDATTSTRHDDAYTNSTMQILKRKDAKARPVSEKRSNPNIFWLYLIPLDMVKVPDLSTRRIATICGGGRR
jgi:hypothetical protein